MSLPRADDELEQPSCSSSCLSNSNSNESIKSSTPSQSLSDVVSFSLCALCAIRSRCLYPELFHEPFRDSTIKRMIEYFKLPNRVELSVKEFDADDEFTFLSSIKQNHRYKTFKIIEELVLLSISSGTYDARMHYLIVNVAELLGIPRDLVEMHCENIYELLLKAQSSTEDQANCDPDSDRYLERRDNRKKIKKYLLIGLASLGGGAAIGLTGGLAAPIVASAFGAVIGAGSIVMSSAAAGVVGSLFGVAGAGLTASKMNKRIGDLEEFSFESLSPENDQTSLTVTIAISGWIIDESEQQFSKPWRHLRHTKEQYCLRYESKYLLELSQAMDYILSMVVSYAAQEALKYTFLAGLMAATAWPLALITMANIIDNPWDVCLGRSAEAGKHLADVLMSRQQGQRPVSLIGFSLGARVIFFCLQELAQRKNSEGIICDVILLGAPVTDSLEQWPALSRIISGRLVNGYSTSDWLLKFLYRTSSAAIRVAGLQPLRWQDRRVTNVDLTGLVGGHMDYYKKLTEILNLINVRTLKVKTGDDDDLITATPLNCSSSIAAVVPECPTGTSNDCSAETSSSSAAPPPPPSELPISGSGELIDSPASTSSGIEPTASGAANISTGSMSSLSLGESISQQSLLQPQTPPPPQPNGESSIIGDGGEQSNGGDNESDSRRLDKNVLQVGEAAAASTATNNHRPARLLARNNRTERRVGKLATGELFASNATDDHEAQAQLGQRQFNTMTAAAAAAAATVKCRPSSLAAQKRWPLQANDFRFTTRLMGNSCRSLSLPVARTRTRSF